MVATDLGQGNPPSASYPHHLELVKTTLAISMAHDDKKFLWLGSFHLAPVLVYDHEVLYLFLDLSEFSPQATRIFVKTKE